MTEPKNPHDAFFKHFMTKPEIAADFLRQHLPAAVLAQVDLSALMLQKDTFVDEALREHFSDLIYQAPWREGGSIHVYVLFDHKSYVDLWVALQLLRYKALLWEKDKITAGVLTPVIPLVIYHGATRWTVPTSFAALFMTKDEQGNPQPLSPSLLPFIPDFAYHLVDLSQWSDEKIRGEIWTQVFQLILKHIYDKDLGARLPAILLLVIALVQETSGLAMLRTVLRYVSRAAKQVSSEELHKAVIEILPEEGGVLMKSIAEQWIEEGEAQGMLKGMAKGRAEGLAEALQHQRRTLMRIIQRRFHPDGDDLVTFAEQFARLNNLEWFSNLIDDALDALVLADFTNKLQPYLDRADANSK